jgi:cellulose biosynthesis protein BcsQ
MSVSVPDIIEAMKEFAKQYSPLIGLVVAGAGALGLGELIRGVLRKLRGADVRIEAGTEAENPSLQSLKEENRKLQGVREYTNKDDVSLWRRQDVIKPDGYEDKMMGSIPILLVANLKGGVGKTTTSAYLASYFERKKGEWVLAIDLDQQGSLCSMLSTEPQLRAGKPADGLKKIIGGEVGEALSQSVAIRGLNPRIDSRLIECDDTFGNFEMKVLMKWLIGDLDGDIRYNLARVLHSPAVQNYFNRVIIDAPPHMTPGLVNALCASTHLVVPFGLDLLSAERVGLTLSNIKEMRGDLFPHLKLAVVVGTLKYDSTPTLKPSERDAVNMARKRVAANYWGKEPIPKDFYVPEDILIPRKQDIANTAGVDVDKNIKCFDPLGERLYEVTGAVKRPSAT